MIFSTYEIITPISMNISNHPSDGATPFSVKTSNDPLRKIVSSFKVQSESIQSIKRMVRVEREKE